MPFRNFSALAKILGFQHAGLRRGLVCVVAEYVPAAEHDIVEFRQLHKIFNLRRSAVGALTQPDRSQLRQRAYRHRMPSPHQFHPRHESRADRAHSGRQHSQLSLWRSNTHRPAHSIPPVRFEIIDEDEDFGSREKLASSAARIAPSLPRARGASRKLRFRSCAADELFRCALSRLDGRNAQNKQFMMRQCADFCKLICPSREGDFGSRIVIAR